MYPFSTEQHKTLQELYAEYNSVIKNLLITIEARGEVLPTPLHNELRSFNDHVARCYKEGISKEDIDSELRKAKGHIKRTIFDCFKFLNVYLFESVRRFEKETNKVDLTSINNGDFYIHYKKLQKEAVDAVRNAKKLEADSSLHEAAFIAYESAFNKYTELEELILDNAPSIKWAKWKYRLKTVSTYVIGLFLFALGAIVSLLIEDAIRNTCPSTYQCFINWLFK